MLILGGILGSEFDLKRKKFRSRIEALVIVERAVKIVIDFHPSDHVLGFFRLVERSASFNRLDIFLLPDSCEGTDCALVQRLGLTSNIL